MVKEIAGRGRRRPQLNIEISKLHLDKENPRLPQEKQGKNENEILFTLYQDFNLDELAESMGKNGYFDEEPLVAFPQNLPKKLKDKDAESAEFQTFIDDKNIEFIVVEGNRRLATAKLLLDSNLRDKLHIKTWPKISDRVRKDLSILPVIVYPERQEVLPYLGVRHIIGIQKWESYAKARYIAKMIDTGTSIDQAQEQIGDRHGSIKKTYLAYKLLHIAQDEFDFNTNKAEKDFSLLLLAIGQGNIKRYLGLPVRQADINLKKPVSKDKLSNLKNLLCWIYGDGKVSPVIKESREITRWLSHVVASPEAVSYLESTKNLEAAFDRSGGELEMLIKYLVNANSKLESALGIAHRHKTKEVLNEAQKCSETATRILETVKK